MKQLFNKKNTMLLTINFLIILGLNILMTQFTDTSLAYRFTASTMLSIIIWFTSSHIYNIVNRPKKSILI
jgi:hypothetical protein